MKIGIAQNAITYGGRLAVIAKMIDVLNDRGHIPDIICLDANIDSENIWRSYGTKISFNLVKIQPGINRLPAEISILGFNMALRRYYQKYDFIIDSNNTSFLMPPRIPVLSYVYYPRISRLKSKSLTIHNPDGPQKSWMSINGAILKMLALGYTFQTIQTNNLVVAISKFTQNAFRSAFPGYKKNIPIIYPPVDSNDLPKVAWEDRDNIVCSAGRFSPEKNQMAQIRLAERTPDFQFNLVGFAEPGNTYYQRCKQYCQQNQVSNVTFYPNISSNEKKSLMQASKFFIHPIINEPFGITTVEAILSGCIPLVHNSGGQKEVVPNKELRFDNMDALQTVFKDCTASKNRFIKIQSALVKNCRENFTTERFREKFNTILDEFQGNYLP